MHLYCWPHDTTHEVGEAEAEEIIYALIASGNQAARAPAFPSEAAPLPCPLEMLNLAQSTEGYLHHVTASLAGRRTARRRRRRAVWAEAGQQP